MAITPKILIHNPAAVAVASLTIFGLTVFCSHHLANSPSDCGRLKAHISTYEVPCTEVAQQMGESRSWGEMQWAVYTQCFQERKDWRLAVTVADEGLGAYGDSEILLNMKAFSQIQQGEYRNAVKTLKYTQMRFPETTSGTTDNNLAWASLWIGNHSLETARQNYQSSLRREPGVCEVLHTGLMVEFAISQRTDGFKRAEAFQSFQNLRRDYEACETRIDSGEWDDFVEVSGAFALYNEMDRSLGITYNLQTSRDLRSAVRVRDRFFPGANFGNTCIEAMPTQLTGLRGRCADAYSVRAERMANGEQDARLIIRR